jgi:GNAT superfamily N-acetyltransferase
MTTSPVPVPVRGIRVRDIQEHDEAAWRQLYAGYRAFYNVAHDESAVTTTWQWMLRREHGLRGIVAVDADGTIVALANLRLYARPSIGGFGLYLDDLFTAPSARGRGAAAALLVRAAEIAAEEGASVVRWITAENNAAARRVYDAHAVATSWITYDMQPRP